jgi:hypothetical protein
MRSCETDERAREIVDGMVELLDEEWLQREIDAPIDLVLAAFSFDEHLPFSHQFFHRTIGDFVRRLYQRGLRLKQNLTSKQARVEALHILRDYEGLDARGYEAAFYDAAHEEPEGIQKILQQMAELVKAREREKHLRWAFHADLDPCDWQTKCQVVAFLVTLLSPWLPALVRNCPTAQLVNRLPDLLLLYIAEESQFKHFAAKL